MSFFEASECLWGWQVSFSLYRLYTQLLLYDRNEGGMPRNPRLEKLETNLADILWADTVNILKANLQILNDMDDAILRALCQKQNGQFYDSLEDRLKSMESHDEYAGELEIKGLVYASCCPVFLYQLQNSIPSCYSQYGDELFPQIQPIKILYHLDQPSQPSHYDLLTGQIDISSAKSVIDQNTTEGNSLAPIEHLCKSAGSFSSEVPIMDVINDIKSLTNNCKEKNFAPISTDLKEVLGGRTFKEANAILSLDSENQFSKSTFRTVQDYAHLSLQEFKLNESEIEAINKLLSVSAMLCRILCQGTKLFYHLFENGSALTLGD